MSKFISMVVCMSSLIVAELYAQTPACCEQMPSRFGAIESTAPKGMI